MTDHVPPDSIDRELLQWLQDEFPITTSPWEGVAGTLKIPESEVLRRVRRLSEEGFIRSFRAFVNSHQIRSSGSTLVGMKVPEADIDRVVAVINAYPWITHNYRRNHEYNIWFTITAPDGRALQYTLEEIERKTGVPGSAILDLRTIRVFKIDVRFQLIDNGRSMKTEQNIAPPGSLLDEHDHALLRITQEGIPLVMEPFQVIGKDTGIPQEDVIFRLNSLHRSGIIKRIGISVNQRKLGITANALVAWKIPCGSVESAGPALASFPEITHCYERSIVPGRWEYNMFTVIHGHDRQTVNGLAETISNTFNIRDYVVLFSTDQFKRTSLVHEFPKTLPKPLQKAHV